MTRSRHLRTATALAICALALAGLAALAFAGADEGGDGVFAAEARDGEVAIESASIVRGRQVVEVANAGTVEHELVVVRTDRAADEIPVGLNGVSVSLAGRPVIGEDHAAAGHDHATGEVLGMLPGESRRYQVDLAPGRYVVLCQTDNHYLEGERTSFEVR